MLELYMKLKGNNTAYIDGANLHKGVKDLGWKLDYKKFMIWLRDKYAINRAYLFIGLVPKYKDLYTYLQEVGFILVFKETVYDGKGNVKGNCDADLVLNIVRDVYEDDFEKVVLVSGDGDYASLVKFLLEKSKLRIIISPNNKCSILIKKTNAPISYLDNQKNKLRVVSNKKAPDMDKTI